MAATARRDLDAGEDDIAAIAKQISDHAEAIYQTWKARGLAPTEILSCRPTPNLKLSDSVRSKPIMDNQSETIEVILPPDIVPQRPEAPRRPAGLAVRLEVAREEERLMRALRTGSVLAERPDVVPPMSLVDYAKTRYQERLENPARSRSAGERRTAGAQVSEARSKLEARARRAEAQTAPVRPFLSRGSVAERVMMFERCPREAILETAAKRKTPAAAVWRAPHDVINKAQSYPGGRPATVAAPRPAHTTLQRSTRRSIPPFHFPRGRPPAPHARDLALHTLQSAFATFPNSQVPRDSFHHIVKACDCPLYWKMPLFLTTQQTLNDPVDGHKFIDFWRQTTLHCHDAASRFVHILTRGASTSLGPEDLAPLVQDVVDTHPGLSFLKEATEFHSRYVHTVIARIFYCVNRSWSGRISIPELRRSNLLQVIQLLEEEEDINQITAYFSYEHFYVIYCKFWELDRDHDLFIDKMDLARHNDHALSSRMIERVLSGCVTRGSQHRLTPDGEPRMSYTEFVWFLLAEEDKTHPTAIEYWFRCLDLDGDGFLSMYELEYFYEEQMHRMEAIGIETLPFLDCLCQMLDMVHPAIEGKITLSDLKRCKLTPVFYDTFFNLEKYLDHEQRDPFASQRDGDCEMSEWDRFAAEEYELLVAEEGGSDAQDQISYDETDEDCLSPNLDDVTATDLLEDSSIEDSSLSEGPHTHPTVARTKSADAASCHGKAHLTGNPAYVNLSSIYALQANERWGHGNAKNGMDKKVPEKPATPEKPVNLSMVNGKLDNKYAGFGGNNSFLYAHLQSARNGKDPPPYTAAYNGTPLSNPVTDKTKYGLNSGGNCSKITPEGSFANGTSNKISENYEKAVSERLSPQKETSQLNRSGFLSKMNPVSSPKQVKSPLKYAADEDDDYARDSDECSI